MLEQAKAKASEAGIEITFIKADIRTLDLHEKFDFIFIPFNSIHHYIRMKIYLRYLMSLKIILKTEVYSC